MRPVVSGKQYDSERALYHLMGTDVIDCVFAGPADGESVLKEARDIRVERSSFSLRYPLWHTDGFMLKDSEMDEKTRAPIWYARSGEIVNSKIAGTKAVRECRGITVKDSRICSDEFGWKSEGIMLENTEIESGYLFLDSKDISLKHVNMKGKYSFQYVENLVIEDCRLDTKDAFWHAHNVTVRNSLVKGEYLAWYSDGLTLIDCRIIGTQPLCYCRNLRLINCTMEDTDLAFEYSDVDAEIKGHILSVKNPRSGVIRCSSVGSVIREDPVMECTGIVVTGE